MTIRILILLVLSLSVAEARDVYRWVAPDGTVHYTEESRPGATRMTLPQWVPPKVTPRPVPTSPRVTDEPKSVLYEQLAITRPLPEENIHDNQGIVGVSVKVSPTLATAKGHRIQLLLDGKAQGEPSQYRGQSLTGVERGEHTVAAQVLDRNDQVLVSSEPVTFYLKHYSPLFYPRQEDVLPPSEKVPGEVDQRYQPDQAERAEMADPGGKPTTDSRDRAEHLPFRPSTQSAPKQQSTPAPPRPGPRPGTFRRL